MPGVVSSIFGNVFGGGGSPFGGGGSPFGGGGPFGIFGGGQNPGAAGRPTTPMPEQPVANLPQANPFGGLADTLANLPQSPYTGHVDRMSDSPNYKTRHMREGAAGRRSGGGGGDSWRSQAAARGANPVQTEETPVPQQSAQPTPQGPLAGNQLVQNWQPIQRYNFGGRPRGSKYHQKGVATRPKL